VRDSGTKVDTISMKMVAINDTLMADWELDSEIFLKVWASLGESKRNLRSVDAKTKDDGSICVSFKARRSVDAIISSEYAFIEVLPETITREIDVMPKAMYALQLYPSPSDERLEPFFCIVS
jgi:hypothetical protein